MYLYLFERIFFRCDIFFKLRTADVLLRSLVLVVLFFTSFYWTSVSSFFEFFGAVCLTISCIEFFDARDISFAALRLSGERSHCVLVFPRVSFSRCRAGE